MKLNHINLPINNVLAASVFFETYFDFKPQGTTNDSLCVLTGDDGFVLVLMSYKLNQNGNNAYPDAFHIGFFQETDEQVITVYDRLKAGGIDLAEEPKRIRKTFGFYFKHQDILIEVSTDVKS